MKRRVELSERAPARPALRRMAQIVEAGKVTREALDKLGLVGSPGFMGTGVYSTFSRVAGYLREGAR